MLDRKKHRQEVESLRADVKRKEMGIKWRTDPQADGIGAVRLYPQVFDD